ncbi:MAG: isocitrate lyase/phosphoenolpyruvate mutase family protein [Pseudomonadota bacterium]
MPTQSEKAEIFKALHHCDRAFLLPNPWDVGSAQMLAGQGAEALATTSAGQAATIGVFDSAKMVSRETAIAHAKDVAEATDLPVSGDFENGYGDRPEDVALTVKQAIEAGLAGCSIEDVTMDRDTPVYDFEAAVARIKAAVEAARTVDFPFQLCARADGVMIRAYDVEEAIHRLKAFEDAGADVIYAPFLPDIASLERLRAATIAPINAIAAGPLAEYSVADLYAAGAVRISLGSTLFNIAIDAAYNAASAMLGEGDLSAINKVRTVGKVFKARKAGMV